jgi:hypothetical protein
VRLLSRMRRTREKRLELDFAGQDWSCGMV